MVLGSLAFYAAWDWTVLPILLTSIAGNYLVAQRLQRHPSRFLLGSGIAVNVGVLAYFKYAGFLTANLAALGGPNWGPVEILLPLGFSFITFHSTT